MDLASYDYIIEYLSMSSSTIGMIKYYFHPTKVNILRTRILSMSRSQMNLFSYQTIQVDFLGYRNIKILRYFYRN